MQRFPMDVQYRGITYTKGQLVVIGNDDMVEFGKVFLTVVKNNLALHVLMRVYSAEYHPQYHIYSVQESGRHVSCGHYHDT